MIDQDTWETEVLGLKEQNQKLISENEKMGGRVDGLHGLIEDFEQDIMVLYNEDQKV